MKKFSVQTRILHCTNAILIFAALLVGFAMVNSVDSYAALVSAHMTIGFVVLLLVLARIINRFVTVLPIWPPTIGAIEGKLIRYSELGMYALISIQPLIGWLMVSASGKPPVVFGMWKLPRIAPFDADLFFVLRQAHSVGAYLLVAVIAGHVSMVLWHTVALRDGMLMPMTLSITRSPAQNDDSQTAH